MWRRPPACVDGRVLEQRRLLRGPLVRVPPTSGYQARYRAAGYRPGGLHQHLQIVAIREAPQNLADIVARQGAQILFLHSGFDWQMLPSFPRPGPAPKHASGARYRLKPIDSAIRLPGRQEQGISTGRREYQHIIRFLYAEIPRRGAEEGLPRPFARYLRRGALNAFSTLGDAHRLIDRRAPFAGAATSRGGATG